MMFSVILPTYNRKDCICRAIDSVLAQSFRDFELIVSDDGSTDGTREMVLGRYAGELRAGRMRYLAHENGGVSRARNRACAVAQGEWFAYVDSDNAIRPDFLASFAEAIAANPQARTFNAKFVCVVKGGECGMPCDWRRLARRNSIDMGVFVHHRSLFKRLGGFDETMRRLVDWDLVLRYTRDCPPVFVDRVVLDYDDVAGRQRITGSRLDYYDWRQVIWRRYCPEMPTVSTVVTTYNQKAFVREAVESAVGQDGEFLHEILVSDDGSNDGTADVVADLAQAYPHLVRNVSSATNRGISENMRKCRDMAHGEFVAVLEGDDYWCDRRKLAEQVGFLQAHPECPMVFSRLIVEAPDGTRRQLKVQDGLPPLMRGRDFFKTGTSSVIVNFSACLFRRAQIANLPECLWKPRLSEIAVAFFLENSGPVGFVDKPLSVYRQQAFGTWTGSSFLNRRQQEIACREAAKQVCAPEYVAEFDREIARIEKVIRRTERAASFNGIRLGAWRVGDAFRRMLLCYADNGLLYTVRRVLFGKQY